MSQLSSDLESHQVSAASGEVAVEDKVASRSPWQLARARFMKDRLSMISFTVVVLYISAAILAPFLVKFGVIDPLSLHNSGKDNLLDVSLGGIPKGDYGGISSDHWLGVEPGTGRDVLSRMWYGISFSLAIALSATILAVAFGTAMGIIAGVGGGIADATIGRLIDLTLSFPSTLMLLALSSMGIAFLTDNLHVPKGDVANGVYVVVVLAAFGWPYVARLMRGQVLSLREREFVDAARLMGASKFRIYFKEILPNLWAPLMVIFTLTMPAYISAEAALSYLSVGIKPPTPTLGNLLTTSISYMTADFVFFFTPAFLIAVIVVSFNLVGDGLRDALDPKGDR